MTSARYLMQFILIPILFALGFIFLLLTMTGCTEEERDHAAVCATTGAAIGAHLVEMECDIPPEFVLDFVVSCGSNRPEIGEIAACLGAVYDLEICPDTLPGECLLFAPIAGPRPIPWRACYADHDCYSGEVCPTATGVCAPECSEYDECYGLGLNATCRDLGDVEACAHNCWTVMPPGFECIDIGPTVVVGRADSPNL